MDPAESCALLPDPLCTIIMFARGRGTGAIWAIDFEINSLNQIGPLWPDLGPLTATGWLHMAFLPQWPPGFKSLCAARVVDGQGQEVWEIATLVVGQRQIQWWMQKMVFGAKVWATLIVAAQLLGQRSGPW